MNKRSAFTEFTSSNAGKRFFNYAYSWGAAVVILGALFKIIHMPGANAMLMVGMITEAIVFFLSGFDDSQAGVEDSETSVSGDGSISIGYSGGGGSVGTSSSSVFSGGSSSSSPGSGVVGGTQRVIVQSNPMFTPEYSANMATAAENMDQFAQIMNSLNEVSSSLLDSYKQIKESTDGVSEKSIGFSDSVQALNHNVIGLNNVYQSQLNSIQEQMNTIKYMNDSLIAIKELYSGSVTDTSVFRAETQKMTRQIEALNEVYARLLRAMTSNNNPPVV